MNTRRMAQDHLAWAAGSLEEAQRASEKKDYPRVIRRAQECIELSSKAVLRDLSIEFPKEHDVSEVLQSLASFLLLTAIIFQLFPSYAA